MKLKTILCTAMLMLVLLTKGKAQTVLQQAQHDSIRVHIVENENGKLTRIDTVVAASQKDELHKWLLSSGIEMPAPPPLPPLPELNDVAPEQGEIVTDDIHGDSTRIVIVNVIDDSIPHTIQKMKIALPPDAPQPPLPPAPPEIEMKNLPPDVPEKNQKVQIIIIRDSSGTVKQKCTKTIIINDAPQPPAAPATPSLEKNAPDKNDVTVYPNPSNGHITLTIDMPGKDKTDVIVTDMNGKTVYSESLGVTEGKVSKEIDLSKNGKGMYNVKIQKAGNVIVERVVIQ